jgi:hypothetical protein
MYTDQENNDDLKSNPVICEFQSHLPKTFKTGLTHNSTLENSEPMTSAVIGEL